jgi:hypothetical protein
MGKLATSSSTSLMRLNDADFQYEPYPIGVTRPIFESELYDDLLNSWPSQELFAFMPTLGKKYSLSEVNEPANYHQYVQSSPLWREVHREIKSPEFVRSVLDLLARQHIDLGIPHDVDVNPAKRRWFPASNWAQKLLPRDLRALKTRFEFSMLPADGGHIKPHTDSPGKIITLVVSMVRPGEWDPQWGGGTTVLRARDASQSFNFLNRQVDFDATEVLDVYEFEPNQCVLFIKTFNSLHAVSPLTGPAEAMRKTLTVNIELA